MSHLSRRSFLGLTLASSAAVVSSQCRRALPGVGMTPSLAPSVHHSQGGLLAVTLQAQQQTVALGDRAATLLTYNGQVPGPRLEVQPGDTVRITFDNQLDQPTNLHYHGLHIPPTGSADNVFLSVPSGEQSTYEFEIPATHPAGTFWYHPHYHGLVAEQLFGGLAGLFVVRGSLDDIPELQQATEAFVVVKDFALDDRGQIRPPGHEARMTGRIGGLLTVNGQVNPQFTIAPGGLLRLRLLNASSSRFFNLSLEDHPLYLIATDGGSIDAPIELLEVSLAPGERAEVLVKGDRPPGAYRLVNRAVNPAQGPGMMHGGGMGPGRGPFRHGSGSPNQGAAEAIATVAYGGAATDLPLPTQLIPVAPLPEPQRQRSFQLNHGMARGQGMVFLINGQPFAHDRIDTQVQLNTVEDWDIVNTGMMSHPFHVHINKFQVMTRNGQPPPFRAWKDVVTVAPGETVRIRMAFQDYPGRTVYHCHVLDHEDLGMMGILDIQPAAG
jgi:FtsP/CotA-like multicopper oxidase with cupredoxin domain